MVLTACGSDAIDCVLPPCLYPTAVIVTVTSASATQPLTDGVFLKEMAPSTMDASCSPGPTATCYVPGMAATYQLQIGSPGFQVVTKTVNVTADPTPKCGCPKINTVHLDVSLSPST